MGTSVLIDNAYHNHPEAFVNGVYRTGIATKFDIPIAAYKPPVIRKPKKDKTGRHYTNWYHTALPWMSSVQRRLRILLQMILYHSIRMLHLN